MTTIRRWQIALIVVGIGLLALGGLVLLDDVKPTRYLGIALWLGLAILIHDGIIAPLVFAVAVVMRRAGRRIPLAVILIIQGALVVGGVMALVVFPEIVKKNIGTANPTMLPLDYAGNLVWFYLVLAAATAAAIGLYLVARRQKLRSSISQA